MTYLIEQLINGICQGAIYALFAIGYTIIVGVVGLVSFTFGEVIMIGAFAALFTATLTGGNILLTILFSFAASGLIGIVIHKICYEKFFESARYIPLICTIGMSMLIKNTVQILFGSETKAMPEVIPLGGIQIGNYRITYAISGAEAGHAGGMKVACVGDASKKGAGDYNMHSFEDLLTVLA